jgi:MYXO-CTERM domain-containing protein
VTDACDPDVTVTFLSGSSDQADNGLGDGNTDNDLVVKPDSICARAERDGRVLFGRTYAIKATATDTAGNQGELTFDITVPHDFSPMCATGGEPTDASDPRCVPPPPPLDLFTEPPANVATSQATPVRDGCSSGGQPRGLVVIGLVMGLTLRRRRHQ